MIYETEKYVEVLVKLGITPNQFLICWLLYNKQYDLLTKYINNVGMFKREDLDVLVDKDLILRTTNDPKIMYDVANMVVTLPFAESIIVEPETAWEELFNAYPNFLIVSDKKFSAKALKISEEHACQERYVLLLKKNKFLHTKILALIEKWKGDNNGYATMKIDKFLVCKYWEEIELSEKTNVKPRLY